MTDLLIKLFVKDKIEDSEIRTTYGNFASLTGIVCNIFLCIIKGLAGLLFNSVAILADAVNNLSDAGNSIISLIGFVISGKPADDDHPYGHARIEYISCLIVSFVIMLLGLSLLKASIDKMLNPVPVSASILSIVILVVSIIIKLWMSFFYKKIGRLINSDVLMANSTDCFNDVISTSAVLLTTIIAIFTKYNFDAYAGFLVAIFIIYSGIVILRDMIDKLLGTTPDIEIVEKIVKKVNSYEGVLGIHDLVVHSYGPDKYFATVHVEVSVHDDILVCHDMIDNIERDFAKDLNINLVIHLDPVVTDDEETNEMKEKVFKIIKSIDECIGMHDFRMVKGETHSNLIFDVVVPYSLKLSEKEVMRQIDKAVKSIDEKLFTVITVDRVYITNCN